MYAIVCTTVQRLLKTIGKIENLSALKVGAIDLQQAIKAIKKVAGMTLKNKFGDIA